MKLSLRQIYGVPLVIGLTSLVGLVTALVGDGVWDAFSWSALAAPVAVIGWALVRPVPRS